MNKKKIFIGFALFFMAYIVSKIFVLGINVERINDNQLKLSSLNTKVSGEGKIYTVYDYETQRAIKNDDGVFISSGENERSLILNGTSKLAQNHAYLINIMERGVGTFGVRFCMRENDVLNELDNGEDEFHEFTKQCHSK